MKKWIDKTGAKVTFFCFLMIFSALLFFTGWGIGFLISENAYLDGDRELLTRYADIWPRSYAYEIVSRLAAGRYLLIVLETVFFGAWIWCLVFTLVSAGHWKGYEGIHLTWLDRIPVEVWGVCVVFLWFVFEDHVIDETFFEILLCAGALIFVYLFLAVFAAQCKAGTVIRESLTARLLRLLWKLALGLWYMAGRIPLVWKTALGVAAFLIFDIFCLACSDDQEIIGLMFAVHVPAGLLLIYLAVGMRKLRKNGRALAEGMYDQLEDTSHLLGDFRRHGEDLKAIREGVQKAVELQMRAERMKTELITNVSHDIKTPLTSIVNYVDLLKKEKIEDPKAAEYIDVLDRQAQRLRRLTENLVEASKAATGNIPVTLADIDTNVFLTQAVGEYQQRLSEQSLELVLTLDETSPHILADGQLLWRVLDNLLSNACKYAMPGTRVYLSSETQGDCVRIILRNISRDPLNVSAGELTERFVRGDASRTTEGSGLGLSIAMSLTRLQKGDFDLLIDGDLFKAQLSFERI